MRRWSEGLKWKELKRGRKEREDASKGDAQVGSNLLHEETREPQQKEVKSKGIF